MWKRIHCFVNFPFPSIQHGILVAKGGQHNGGTSKHKKYISHRQHQDTARVRFGEANEFFLRLWNAAIVWATHRQNAYTCKFLFMLWSAAIVLATRKWKTYFLWVAFFFFHRGLQFSYFKFPFLLLLLCSAMYTLATEQRTGAELYLAASMWNQETAPTRWNLTQHSRIPDLHPLGLASKPPWGWTMGGGQ